MSAKRKPLDDIAAQFVYGSTVESPTKIDEKSAPGSQQQITNSSDKSSYMQQLKAPEKKVTVRLSVDLDGDINHKLSVAALRAGKKKVELIRIFINEGLEKLEQEGIELI